MKVRGVLVETVAVAYPSVGQLFTVANAGQVVGWAVHLKTIAQATPCQFLLFRPGLSPRLSTPV